MPRGIFTRRETLGVLSSALAAPFLIRGAAAQPAWWLAIPEAAALIGTAVPSTDGLAIELPFVSEDGSAVDLSLAVDRPMTPEAYVQSLHFFAPGNPTPPVVDYFFSPLSGRAAIATRVRLNQSQTVSAIAKMSTGEVIVGERDIRITVSGCLVRAATYDSTNLMLTRVRAADRFAPGAPGEITTLINHPMETGLRANAAGEILPQNIVTRFLASFERATVFEARFHRSVAANPYLRFFVAPPRSGELALRWEEDTGLVAQERVALQVG